VVEDAGHPQQPIAPLLQAAFGAQTTQILHVAAKLAIADSLRDGPRPAAELARSLGVDVLALERILRGLVSLAICDEIEGARFCLTSLGQYLRGDHPDSIQARAILSGEVTYALWGEMLTTAKTGESASQRIFGLPFYDYLAHNTAVGSLFDRVMASAGWARYRFRPAVDAYDFGQFRLIVDGGGGTGALMTEILNAYARPVGVVFDVPRLAEDARQSIEAAGLGRTLPVRRRRCL